METWWIVRPMYLAIAVPARYLSAWGRPKIDKTKVGPFWTRGEASRVLRLWKGFSG